ncbi:methanol/ethanol family PQQ-dependent dehydrogenase [Methyloceanibacter marginalis]|jgi:PQQ-dependent dehydrogenase (methanol/ethanol family)|uniref:methanol/ethanol family PQQ-dependent dehydrogenase n=1 Tax=Methyloceanibacter marginalis TaxID=1774971 RepID=UPI0009F2801E|nr:methanol/ethanol family PQQ-dependent dehydrogenase [Methyloceanibacter marginalis]
MTRELRAIVVFAVLCATGLLVVVAAHAQPQDDVQNEPGTSEGSSIPARELANPVTPPQAEDTADDTAPEVDPPAASVEDEQDETQHGETAIYSNDTDDAAKPASGLEALSADPKQWPMAGRDYGLTRFSELNEINIENAGRLQMAWTFSLGTNRGQEAAPLIIDNVLYVVGPYPNRVFALDATTGELKWMYTPKPNPAAQGVACCDVVNRGLAYNDGRIFLNTLDAHTVALDAKTGKEIWYIKLGEINRGETITMAPLAAAGKVFVGNSGGEMGVRGWLTALDQETGEIAWRAYSTGPDEDVLIGDDFEPYYDHYKEKDLGVSSWPPDHWKNGGGTVWGWVSYDPELNLVFYGTANPGPWNSNQRPGDNLWTTTLFARDADTGRAKWAYQVNPHDLWDYDEINENILLDLEIDGRARKVLVHVGRNGFMYVMDRKTGEIISADKYGNTNSIERIDLETGRPIENESMKPELGKVIRNVCPASPGAKDWQPSAWSPRTKLLYVPHQNLCMNFKTSEVGYIAGTPFVGATVDMYAGPGGHRGEFLAWDPIKREKVWAIKEHFPVWSGTVVTAGDVAFYGTMDRWFKAVNAKTGELLWKFRAGSGFIGQPVTYEGSDGRQYVAILSGVGGWSGAVAAAEIDPRVRNGALGFTGAMQDLPAYTLGGSELLVFAIPETDRAEARNTYGGGDHAARQ